MSAEYIWIDGNGKLRSTIKTLTGKKQTSKYDEFTSGVDDKNASVRIPQATNESGQGYLEDRRPSSNADPYLVTSTLATTSLL
jgi:glutamine synthetase